MSKFGPDSKPFPRTYVPPEITTFFSDPEAYRLMNRACTKCHGMDRVQSARKAEEGWRVTLVDMRERGAQLSDEELERLVEWLDQSLGNESGQMIALPCSSVCAVATCCGDRRDRSPRYTATTANVSGAPDSIRIDILRWSTDAERDKLMDAWMLKTAVAPARGGRGGGRERGGAAELAGAARRS